ncbi:MAG: thiol peroxidase [Acidimicrobiales bacterium]
MAEITLGGNPIHTSGDLPAVGSPAPAFTVTKADFSSLSSADLAGTPVVLNIFPSIDTAVCATSVRTFNERASGLDATVVCVSADLPPAAGRFCGAEGIENVTTGSTFKNPEVLDAYGVRITDGKLEGLAARLWSSSARTARSPTASWCPRSPRNPTTTPRSPRWAEQPAARRAHRPREPGELRRRPPVAMYDWLLAERSCAPPRARRRLLLGGDRSRGGTPGVEGPRGAEQRVGISLTAAPDESRASLNTMMIMMDRSAHTAYRRLVSSAFTPRGSAGWTDRVEALARQIVDAVAPRGECELVAEVAGEMPSFVVADMLGLPPEEGRQLYHWTEIVHTDASAVSETDRAEAVMNLIGRGMEVYEERRAHPGDDLGSLIANAAVDGHEMTMEAFASFFMLLVDAGGDTTRNLVAAGIEKLLADPALLDWLVADLDARLPSAVEELLRVCSPVVHMGRQALADVTIGDTLVRAGERVVLFYGAANRDPVVFARPDVIDLARDPNPHVAFGAGGPHFCLGSHLARIEIIAILREFLRRCRDLEPAGPVERLTSSFIAGPRAMPVRFTPEA